jgi:Domain of unknown function (DUF3425)
MDAMDNLGYRIDNFLTADTAKLRTCTDSSALTPIRAFSPVVNNPSPLPDRVARCLSWTNPEAPLHRYWAVTVAQSRKMINQQTLHESERPCLEPNHPCESQLVPSLPADHLLSLIYYNVFRAFVSIIRAFDLDLVRMYHEDHQSPFILQPNSCKLSNLPSMLHPTRLQRSIPHHPMVDVLVSPTVRDNMLIKGQYHKDDGKICDDIVGNGNYECDIERDECVNSEETRGLIVWGDPFDIANWEVGDGFAKIWGWSLEGAKDLENSTNAWRSKRGERFLRFT